MPLEVAASALSFKVTGSQSDNGKALLVKGVYQNADCAGLSGTRPTPGIDPALAVTPIPQQLFGFVRAWQEFRIGILKARRAEGGKRSRGRLNGFRAIEQRHAVIAISPVIVGHLPHRSLRVDVDRFPARLTGQSHAW